MALVLAAATALALPAAAHARPLTDQEARTLRDAPLVNQARSGPDDQKRLQAALQMAHRLGMEGNAEAVPLLLELRQDQLLAQFAGSYSGQATPVLEALALQHFNDTLTASRLLAMLKNTRSAEVFEAVMRALPEERLDCHLLLRVAAGAQLPGVEARLARLLPTLHPAFAGRIAERFAESNYLEGAPALADLMRRTRLDANNTVMILAEAMSRMDSDIMLDAVARKLIEVAAAPDGAPARVGDSFHVRNEDIPKDGLVCSTPDLRMPRPLYDARSRQVKRLINSLASAMPGSELDRGLFGPRAMALFTPAEQKDVQAMLDQRARTEATAREPTTENLLYWMLNNKPYIVRRFIERGIDLNRPTPLGERPLVYAARMLSVEPLDMLLEAGANPNLPNVAPDRETPTALIAMANHQATEPARLATGVRIMKALIARGADVRARDAYGATALHRAASRHPELATLLLEAGAAVNAADRDGATPLHRAVQGRQIALVRTLLDRGADVNAEEGGGATPLLLARDNEDTEMARLLASRGGRINHAYFLKREAIRLIYTRPGGGK